MSFNSYEDDVYKWATRNDHSDCIKAQKRCLELEEQVKQLIVERDLLKINFEELKKETDACRLK